MPRLVKRKEIILYLNTTPTAQNESWGLYGNKSTTATYSYNPSSTNETYIVDDNVTITLDNYNVTIDGDMKCYFGDAIYDFINKLRYDLAVGDDAVTKALLIDKYDVTDGKFKAQKFNCTISVDTYGGDGGITPKITFNIGLNGTPSQGTVQFEGTTPVFTENTNVSL